MVIVARKSHVKVVRQLLGHCVDIGVDVFFAAASLDTYPPSTLNYTLL